MGERRAGEFQVDETGRSGRERRVTKDRRRGSERRESNHRVPVERRIGFDRRTLRDRRAPLGQRHDTQPIWGSGAEAMAPPRQRARPSPVPFLAEAPPFARHLLELAHLEMSEAEAERQWRAIARHRRNLSDRLGRDAGQQVATLDYFVNISPRLAQPTIIESAALDEIERNAMRDPLTGLFNRRFLEASLKREVERCRRHRVMVSLLMLDLDDLKATNDRFGHPAGDLALQALSELTCRNLRAVDIPCRYGGDAFAVVLPDTDPSNARVAAERISVDAGRYFAERSVGGCYLALTVTVGIATYGEGCATVEGLLQAADHALNQAKAAGGNRVIAES